jgi:hypothetical protein
VQAAGGQVGLDVARVEVAPERFAQRARVHQTSGFEQARAAAANEQSEKPPSRGDEGGQPGAEHLLRRHSEPRALEKRQRRPGRVLAVGGESRGVDGAGGDPRHDREAQVRGAALDDARQHADLVGRTRPPAGEDESQRAASGSLALGCSVSHGSTASFSRR